jgi:hypothetical protein
MNWHLDFPGNSCSLVSGREANQFPGKWTSGLEEVLA